MISSCMWTKMKYILDFGQQQLHFRQFKMVPIIYANTGKMKSLESYASETKW